jgi:hypothetical protein
MTQYAKDFSDELTTGVFASDFTSRYATTSDWTIESTPADSEDDRNFQSDGTGSGIQLCSWDDIDGDANRANCEILCRFQMTDDDDNQPQLWARASGSGGNETGYVMQVRSTGDIAIAEYQAGSYAAFDTLNADLMSITWEQFTNATPAWTFAPEDLWLYFRFRVNGTGATVSLKGKAWIDGIAMINEPDEWMLEADDTSANRITTAGWTGLGRAVHTGTLYIDYFSVGTNGDAAPLNASTNTTMRISSVYAEVIGQQTNPTVQLTRQYLQVLEQASAPTVRVSSMHVKVLHDRDTSASTDVSGQLIITSG